MNRIKSVTTGHREIMGTHWPVEYFVTRQVNFGRPYWLLTEGLCNGISDGSRHFNTRKAALAALAEYGTCALPVVR